MAFSMNKDELPIDAPEFIPEHLKSSFGNSQNGVNSVIVSDLNSQHIHAAPTEPVLGTNQFMYTQPNQYAQNQINSPHSNDPNTLLQHLQQQQQQLHSHHQQQQQPLQQIQHNNHHANNNHLIQQHNHHSSPSSILQHLQQQQQQSLQHVQQHLCQQQQRLQQPQQRSLTIVNNTIVPTSASPDNNNSNNENSHSTSSNNLASVATANNNATTTTTTIPIPSPPPLPTSSVNADFVYNQTQQEFYPTQHHQQNYRHSNQYHQQTVFYDQPNSENALGVASENPVNVLAENIGNIGVTNPYRETTNGNPYATQHHHQQQISGGGLAGSLHHHHHQLGAGHQLGGHLSQQQQNALGQQQQQQQLSAALQHHYRTQQNSQTQIPNTSVVDQHILSHHYVPNSSLVNNALNHGTTTAGGMNNVNMYGYTPNGTNVNENSLIGLTTNPGTGTGTGTGATVVNGSTTVAVNNVQTIENGLNGATVTATDLDGAQYYNYDLEAFYEQAYSNQYSDDFYNLGNQQQTNGTQYYDYGGYDTTSTTTTTANTNVATTANLTVNNNTTNVGGANAVVGTSITASRKKSSTGKTQFSVEAQEFVPSGSKKAAASTSTFSKFDVDATPFLPANQKKNSNNNLDASAVEFVPQQHKQLQIHSKISNSIQMEFMPSRNFYVS